MANGLLLFRILCLSLILNLHVFETVALPYPSYLTSSCLGIASSSFEHQLSLNCSLSELIAVGHVKYVFKHFAYKECNKETPHSDCCTEEVSDCAVYYHNDALNCTGQTACTILLSQLQVKDYPQCTYHLNISTYIELSYYCINDETNFINLADTADEKTAHNVFLQSFMFPDPNVNISRTCSVEVTCGSSIVSTVIYSQLSYRNTSQDFVENLLTSSVNNSNIYILNSGDSVNFMYFTLSEYGCLWLMFSASDLVSNVTVTCGSDAQNMSTKVCPSKTFTASTNKHFTTRTTPDTIQTQMESTQITNSMRPLGTDTDVTSLKTPVGHQTEITKSQTQVTYNTELKPLQTQAGYHSQLTSSQTPSTFTHLTTSHELTTIYDLSADTELGLILGYTFGAIVVLSILIITLCLLFNGPGKKMKKAFGSRIADKSRKRVMAWV